MAELTIFGYRHGASVLHKTDPRFKIICLVLISLACVKANAWALAVLTFILAIIISHVGLVLKSAFKNIRYVFILLMFIFLARIFFSPGTPVFQFIGISVTKEGISDGIVVCWRLFNVIVVGLLFVSTTRSSKVKSAIEWFLAAIPFIPAKRVATMMSLLMRFLPVILDQAKETADAQRARCIETRKNPAYRISKWGIPLIRRIFERADKLTLAMEARCYSEERTDQGLTANRNDWIMLVSVIAFCAVMIVLP